MTVAEALPGFSSELRALLSASDQPDLAQQVDRLELLSRCGCKDDFCSTFYTGGGRSWNTIELEPTSGMVNVDLDDTGRIITVEVLYRPDVEDELASALQRMRRAT